MGLSHSKPVPPPMRQEWLTIMASHAEDAHDALRQNAMRGKAPASRAVAAPSPASQKADAAPAIAVDLWHHVAEYCTFSERQILRQVSKNVCLRVDRSMTHLNIGSQKELDIAVAASYAPHVRSLLLSGGPYCYDTALPVNLCSLEEELFLTHVRGIPQNFLQLFGASLAAVPIASLALTCPPARALSRLLTHSNTLTSLTVLNLTSSDDLLAALAAHPALTALCLIATDLGGAPGPSDEDDAALGKAFRQIRNLQELALLGVGSRANIGPGIENESLRTLIVTTSRDGHCHFDLTHALSMARYARITSLQLGHRFLDAAIVEALAANRTLTSLVLETPDPVVSSFSMNDSDNEEIDIDGAPQLRFSMPAPMIMWYDERHSGDQLALLATMPALTRLHISATSISQQHARAILNAPLLSDIHFYYAQWDDAALEMLAQAPTIRLLDLSTSEINTRQLRSLAGNPALAGLIVANPVDATPAEKVAIVQAWTAQGRSLETLQFQA